jgi:Helix-turn-helix domain
MLTPEQRHELDRLIQQQIPIRAIARRLGRDVKIIRRALDRPPQLPGPSCHSRSGGRGPRAHGRGRACAQGRGPPSPPRARRGPARASTRGPVAELGARRRRRGRAAGGDRHAALRGRGLVPAGRGLDAQRRVVLHQFGR